MFWIIVVLKIIKYLQDIQTLCLQRILHDFLGLFTSHITFSLKITIQRHIKGFHIQKHSSKRQYRAIRIKICIKKLCWLWWQMFNEAITKTSGTLLNSVDFNYAVDFWMTSFVSIVPGIVHWICRSAWQISIFEHIERRIKH